MAKESNTPTIRFDGFNDTWKQSELGELVTTTYGGGTPSTDVEEYWGGSIPWIQSSNVEANDCFNIDIPKGITQLGVANSAAQIVPPNSVAVVTHVGVGKLVYLPFAYTTSQDFVSLSGLQADARFMCYSLYKRLTSELHIVQGSAIKGITKEDLLKKELSIPCYEEQELVGSCLYALDKLLDLNQQKYDKLCNFKKAMLEKMFPKEGESVPEIRFEGFDEPWKQYQLEDFSNKVVLKNTDRHLTETFTNSAEQGIISQCDYFEHDITNEANIENYNIVRPDDYVYNPRISTTAPVGPISRNRLNRTGIMSPLYTVFEVDKTVNKSFIEQYFKTSRWHAFMFLEGNSGARSDRFSIADATFFQMPLTIPSLAEQHSIAAFLERIDSLIGFRQQELDALNNLKKALLDKMFV